MEDETLERSCDAWVVLQDFAKHFLQERALDYNAVDLKLLTRVETFLVPDLDRVYVKARVVVLW